MTDKLKFINPQEVYDDCVKRIAILRARIPVTAIVLGFFTEMKELDRTPNVRWSAQLLLRLKEYDTALEISGFVIDKPKYNGFLSGHIKFKVTGLWEAIDYYVEWSDRGGFDPDTLMRGYRQDPAHAESLESKLPSLLTVCETFNDCLAGLCAASTFAVDASLPAVDNPLYPLSSALQWYELAGDPYKSKELAKRGIQTR